MNITSDFKYHFVYETTCLVTGKRYIGKHSTNNINDGYLGSGAILKKAIAKYGQENFNRVILKFCETLDDCLKLEAELITEDVILSDDYYNLKGGGEGGVYHQDVKDKISAKAMGRKNSRESIEKARQTRLSNGGWASGKDHPMYGKPVSHETVEKFRNTLLKKYATGEISVWNKGVSLKDLYDEDTRKRYGRNTSGELNPSHGSKWLGNAQLGVKCYIKNNPELEELLKSKGWVEKPTNFNSLKSVTKIIQEYI